MEMDGGSGEGLGRRSFGQRIVTNFVLTSTTQNAFGFKLL